MQRVAPRTFPLSGHSRHELSIRNESRDRKLWKCFTCLQNADRHASRVQVNATTSDSTHATAVIDIAVQQPIAYHHTINNIAKLAGKIDWPGTDNTALDF